jgi:hypothetical protein
MVFGMRASSDRAEAALGYDEALAVLRGQLVAARANASVFGSLARAGSGGLLSPRGWAELADIEAELARQLEQNLRRELRADPFPVLSAGRAFLRQTVDRFSPERALAQRRLTETRELPLSRWRAGIPQLENGLWDFTIGRSHHLANTLALALNEPAPFPVVVWQPARRQFRR